MKLQILTGEGGVNTECDTEVTQTEQKKDGFGWWKWKLLVYILYFVLF